MYCAAKSQKYYIKLNHGEQNTHHAKRHYLKYSYDLGELCLSSIPQELLDYVKVASYENTTTEANIDEFINKTADDHIPNELE